MKQLLSWYPKARIFCISGPMISPGEGSELVKASVEAAGSEQVSFVQLKRDMKKEGLGGHWHPNLTTNAANAEVLTAAIAEKTGWKAGN